ncbi:oxygen-independent coproporphyrinogen III oxidase [Aurantimonas sp. VKM B-3413]|uniref:oxygen-independent coproporphyrinogen III oxidase n=1 Tax=Aurantimonas sp. VKM B-3413 TaxID=2779401 RepID=UPI001E31D4CA|nr:oxygen-independent coproporphyrinogen III oxidase [Aurantimonas sp. VKM B-3413]MCB8838581.1 oxygen-independent coproporphyrinogen III oxidase [Aurantimonas sp. VKM B-3413]
MLDAAAILNRHGAQVPRYTSYPAAPHFGAETGRALLPAMIDCIDPEKPVSVYLHIPFCDRLCWFCGCHTKQTRRYQPVVDYVDSLLAEIATMRARIGFAPKVAALHLGGGSPSLLQSAEFARIGEALRKAFVFPADAEISVEIDPSDVSADTLEGLALLGMTRASIGVQDFDPAVQAAINRPQTFEATRDVIAALRAAGQCSINIDALYGLPLQTPERLERTIDQVISLDPERVALFGYAHVPWAKKHQTMIREEDLPGREQRLGDAARASAKLTGAGYAAIGIDHFARPGDPLAEAARTGRLHRNFQGYTTDACETLIGFGASAISRFRGGYVQNIVPTATYRQAVDSGALAAQRGYRLTRDDVIRGYMIERLMCDFRIDFAALAHGFGEVAGAPYVRECLRLAAGDRDGLVVSDEQSFAIRPEAKPFARVVASWFDAHLDGGEGRYSKAV